MLIYMENLIKYKSAVKPRRYNAHDLWPFLAALFLISLEHFIVPPAALSNHRAFLSFPKIQHLDVYGPRYGQHI
jgi:hypothetical protein